jgi:threonine dehydratase
VVEVDPRWLPRSDVRLFLKLECRQRSGSFKARGANHFLARLLEGEPPPGVVTYSSGNHGRAVAEAAREQGIPAVVTVPDDVDRSKESAIQAAGAETMRAGPTSASREEVARRIARERGYVVVPPFDHAWIVAGQGTTALEILEQVPEVTAVWAPVGGGGLASGIATVFSELQPDATIYAVEPETAAPFAASHQAGERVVLESVASVADGLLPLGIGELNWNLLSRAGAQPVTLSDERILASLRRLRRDLEIESEPSGAVAPAPLLFSDEVPEGAAAPPGVHVAVVSGGNVAAERLARLLAGP